VRIATRASALALAQATWVAEQLPGEHELVKVTTSGDRGEGSGDRGAVRDKTRWVDAVERALLDGEADLAVHSAKDVPSQLAPGTVLLGSPPREDPRDALLGELRPGARVGTSSLRRRAQLLAAHDDIEVVELRGNVDTRLRKLDAGEADGIVLAAAGLQRLAITREVTPLAFIPAPGQGTLAVEARADDERVRVAVQPIHDAATFAHLAAERAAVRVLGATCHTPVGIHANDGTMRGFVGLPDGSAWVADKLPGTDGEALARRMLAAGAGDLLAQAEALA
jgi:hydroxymethylbilane synthase